MFGSCFGALIGWTFFAFTTGQLISENPPIKIYIKTVDNEAEQYLQQKSINIQAADNKSEENEVNKLFPCFFDSCTRQMKTDLFTMYMSILFQVLLRVQMYGFILYLVCCI